MENEVILILDGYKKLKSKIYRIIKIVYPKKFTTIENISYENGMISLIIYHPDSPLYFKFPYYLLDSDSDVEVELLYKSWKNEVSK